MNSFAAHDITRYEQCVRNLKQTSSPNKIKHTTLFSAFFNLVSSNIIDNEDVASYFGNLSVLVGNSTTTWKNKNTIIPDICHTCDDYLINQLLSETHPYMMKIPQGNMKWASSRVYHGLSNPIAVLLKVCRILLIKFPNDACLNYIVCDMFIQCRIDFL